MKKSPVRKTPETETPASPHLLQKKREAAKQKAEELGVTMAGLASHLGISKQALYARLRNPSMTLEASLTPGALAFNPRAQEGSIRKLCAEAGVPENTYWNRRRRGLPHEQALGQEPPSR